MFKQALAIDQELKSTSRPVSKKNQGLISEAWDLDDSHVDSLDLPVNMFL